jgi:hypothetical protein
MLQSKSRSRIIKLRAESNSASSGVWREWPGQLDWGGPTSPLREPMTVKEHLSKHDREIAAIRKLILVGMKMINRNQEQINQLTVEVRAVAASVRELTNSLKRGVNGHSRRKIDLQ